jgi:hypothetical protein
LPITPLHPTNPEENVQKDVATLANDLEKLKGSYEQYFLGLERRAPDKLREKVLGLIRKHSGTTMQNARTKFRFQQLVARYNTFTTYWDRVLREIEEGTYQRDVFKWKIHHEDREEKKEASAKANPKAKPQADPLQALYNSYLAEKKKNNEEVKSLSYDKFKTQMAAQLETLKKRTGNANLKLVAVTEGGKAKIKALTPAPAKK